MTYSLYQVDAFTDRLFGGNPAAVVPLKQWLDDDLLTAIAAENNLSETAFIVAEDDGYQLRWFTPIQEVDLCGHATLAAAHVLFEHLDVRAPNIRFQTRSGQLIVKRDNGSLSMDFPAEMPQPVSIPAALLAGLNAQPRAVTAAFDYIVELDNEDAVRGLNPELLHWQHLDKRGVVVTAEGDEHDFVSRCFFPKIGVNEDPVTGSAHCELSPYWANKLDKTRLIGEQCSRRRGLVECQLSDDRVKLYGKAITYFTGQLHLPE